MSLDAPMDRWRRAKATSRLAFAARQENGSTRDLRRLTEEYGRAQSRRETTVWPWQIQIWGVSKPKETTAADKCIARGLVLICIGCIARRMSMVRPPRPATVVPAMSVAAAWLAEPEGKQCMTVHIQK